MRLSKDRSGKLCFCKSNAMVAGVLNALYPSRCRSCGQLFDPLSSILSEPEKTKKEARWIKHSFHRMTRPWVCAKCRVEFVPITTPKCSVCSMMFHGEGIDHVCGRCQKERPVYDKARSVGFYSGSLMRLVHRFKYDRRVELARPLGRLMRAVWLRQFGVDHFDLIIPVPLHVSKMRKRGFNQAVLLASSWYPSTQVPRQKQTLPTLAIDSLKRVKPTPPLTGLNRKERRSLIRGAFAVTRPEQIKKKTILLIDDVCTTGATANECAKELKRHKARRVDLLTLARA